MPRKAARLDPESLNIAQRNIAALVAAEGLSVNAWAARYGVSQTSINRIVTGKQDPSAGYLLALAAAVSARSTKLEAWQLLAPDLGQGLVVDAAAAQSALDALRAALRGRDAPGSTVIGPSRHQPPSKPPGRKGNE